MPQPHVNAHGKFVIQLMVDITVNPDAYPPGIDDLDLADALVAQMSARLDGAHRVVLRDIG